MMSMSPPAKTTTTTESRRQAVGTMSSDRLKARRQQPRLVAAATVAAVGLVALSGFPRADAFFAAAPTTTTTMAARGLGGSPVVAGRGRKEGVVAEVARVCRGRGERIPGVVRMTSEQESDGQEGDKPQFIPSKDMTTSTKEMLTPPDREAAMKMVADRESQKMALGDMEDLSYNSADIQDLPKPPYYFKTPGESGNDTLCTDPTWHIALLAFQWLGLPYEVQHDDEEDVAIMMMGDEEYDEPDQLLAGLPERVLLSDFVESQDPVTNAIAKLEPAWKRLHFHQAGKTDPDTDEKRLNDCLQKIENILLKHGPARGPFVEGDDLTVGDLTLAVTTYHMQAAFSVDKQWTMSDKLVKLKAHMKLFHGMQMFGDAMPSPEQLAKKYAVEA